LYKSNNYLLPLQQKNSTASQHAVPEICPHQIVSPKSSRKQLRSTATTKESTEIETDHDKASQLLSMSKQTADSIVAMMKILHRQLHAGEEYSDMEDDTQILDYPCKSILKSMNKKGQLLPSSSYCENQSSGGYDSGNLLPRGGQGTHTRL